MRQSRVGSAFVLALGTEPSSSTSFRRMSALCWRSNGKTKRAVKKTSLSGGREGGVVRTLMIALVPLSSNGRVYSLGNGTKS